MKFEIRHRWNNSVLFSFECTSDDPKQAEREAVIEAVKQKAYLRDADLSGANLRGADLRDADLSGANLRGADLRDANLRDAYLRGADLSGANLRGADLSGADLRDANLSGANLRGADLRDANLRDAYLRGADLSGANLRGADLSGADLRDANLSGANLRGADLRDANLRDAYLRDADLSGANLRGADLSGANLRGADLRDADLSGANLEPIRDDLWAVLSAAPREVPGLRLALIEGRVDGSTYTGECACLVGTLDNERKQTGNERGPLPHISSRPAEMFFLSINKGDMPETNQHAKIAVKWIDTWLANVRQLQPTA